MPENPTAPRILLRIEGAVVLVGALLFYRELGASWLLFAVLFLAPDLAILAYLRPDARIGAVVYNAVHTYLWPGLLYLAGFVAASTGLMSVGLAWAAHIALDRAIGFGLKYPTAFRDTHLGRV